MMNGHRPWFDHICRVVDLPIVGPLLYWLNVNRLVVRHMAAGHVCTDARWLHDERLREKLAVTRSAGARFSSIRFVTGKLDPLTTRTEFLDWRGGHLFRYYWYMLFKPRRVLARKWKHWHLCRVFTV